MNIETESRAARSPQNARSISFAAKTRDFDPGIGSIVQTIVNIDDRPLINGRSSLQGPRPRVDFGSSSAILRSWVRLDISLGNHRDQLLAGGPAALKSRPADDRDEEEEIARPPDHGQRAADLAPLRRPLFCTEEADEVGRTVSPSTGSKDGPARVCRLRDLPRSNVHSRPHRRAIPDEQRSEPRKRGPVGACSDEKLVGYVLEALEPPRQDVGEHFGGFDRGVASGPALHHDHGGAYLSHDFQAELAFLRMSRSPGLVREPEGNRVARPFIRSLKENLHWIRDFGTVAELARTSGKSRNRTTSSG